MAIQLDIDLLRSFAVVAETQVLSRAAEKIGRTQAAISMQMKRLEAMLGKQLLIRSGRGVTLTVHGERLLIQAHKILNAHDEAIAELCGESLSGKLSLGCPEDYAMAFLAPLLNGFSREHPHVQIEVVCAHTPRLTELLKQQSLDVAIVSLPDGVDSDSVLRREQLVWVSCKGDQLYTRVPLQIALSDKKTLDHQAAIDGLNSLGIAYRIAYASESFAGLIAVVRSGQAIAVLTESSVPSDLEILSPSRELPRLPYVGIALKYGSEHSSPVLNAFSAHVGSMLPVI